MYALHLTLTPSSSQIGPKFLEIRCKVAVSRRTESRYCLTTRYGEKMKL